MANKDRTRDQMTDDDKKDAAGMVGGAFAGGALGGVAGGAAAGAAAGGLGGPAGAAIGAAVGAVAGALGGKAIADRINPEAEDDYWKSNYSSRSYVTTGSTYDDYQPAYALGYNSAGRYPGSYDMHENELSSEWERTKGNSRLSWEQAKHASRAAWHKVERAIPGDADGDGR